MTNGMKRLLIFLGMLFIFAVLVTLILWNIYDPGVWVKQGRWSREFAVSTTIDFALIQAALAAVVWSCLICISGAMSPVKYFCYGSLATFAVLMLFVIAFLWSCSRYAVLGATNWVFFSEDGVLVYAIVVLPLVSLLSGALLCLKGLMVKALTSGVGL